MKKMNRLSENSRKALIVNIGESAGQEVADLIAQMAAEIEELRQTKVSVTPIIPGVPGPAMTIEEPV